MQTHSWLLLLFSLPAGKKTERVSVWRRLKKSGAIQLTTSTYVLPDRPSLHELFQWLAKQIRDYGGEATLIRAQEIEGLSNEKLVQLFNSAREAEYGEIGTALRKLMQRSRKKGDSGEAVEKLKKQFRTVREVDFFDAPRGREVEVLLRRAEESAPTTKSSPAAKLPVKRFQGKTWVTRPRPEIDRVGSAWLIRRFIDEKAQFVFAPKPTSVRDALPFDFPEGEFSHHGEDCTFETLLKRFGITDKHLRKIGEMVHDADLEDDKFQRPECIGIDRALKGWAKRGMPDDDILLNGGAFFDGLYAYLQRL
ncbi:MAG TPA: chromate resistance protein ChrB domain-containing protein [Chthoniobacterales bacterium]|nr:chromate resistance protein ChrB domain-containing protein [Chthoniobacterales bacterium]